MAASVLTRLKNQAKAERIPFQLVLQLFAQEEFLRKLSRSEYANHFVLKGGMFIYTLTEFQSRPTKDIDFLLRDLHGSMDNIEQTMKTICAIGTGNDFIQLEVIRTEKITLEKKYPGVKTTLVGKIGKVRMSFSIDVGIDDVIVPLRWNALSVRDFRTLNHQSYIHILWRVRLQRSSMPFSSEWREQVE